MVTKKLKTDRRWEHLFSLDRKSWGIVTLENFYLCGWSDFDLKPYFSFWNHLPEKSRLSFSAALYGGLCLSMGSARVNSAVLLIPVQGSLESSSDCPEWQPCKKSSFWLWFFLQLGVVVAPHALKLPEEPITQRGEYWCEVTVNGLDTVRVPMSVVNFERPKTKRYKYWLAQQAAKGMASTSFQIWTCSPSKAAKQNQRNGGAKMDQHCGTAPGSNQTRNFRKRMEAATADRTACMCWIIHIFHLQQLSHLALLGRPAPEVQAVDLIS